MAGYDAFISYSHAADSQLAPALQRAVQRFAKPWWKLRALNLFHDETSMAAASSLSGALLKALDSSRFFILLASPRAAASKWCNEEVAHWLRQRSSDTLLIVLTEGTIAWDDSGNDFDWTHTDALPPALKGALASEPFWLDLSWARRSEQVNEREPRFQQVVAKLAATLHERSLEDISGDEVRQHRRTRQVAATAVAAIAALAIGAGVAAWEATRARHEAEANAAEAERQRAAAQKSEQEAKTQRDLAERALAQTLDASDTLVIEIADGMKDFVGVPRARVRRVLERVDKILDALPPEATGSRVQLRRVQLSMVFSGALLNLGDTEQALRRATMALEIARRESDRAPQDPDWQREVAVGFDTVGGVQAARGDLRAALRSYEAARPVFESLVKISDSRNTVWQRDQAVNLDRIGGVQVLQGDLSAALRSFEASRAIRERLAKSDPASAALQQELAQSLAKLGELYVARGELASALRLYDEGRAIRDRLAKSEAGNAAWQADLMASLNMIGDVQMMQGNVTAALRSFESARSIAERLSKSDPGNPEWQANLAASFIKAGGVELSQGNLAAALRSFEASRQIHEQLARSDPGNTERQRNLFVSLDGLGSVQIAQRDLAAALRTFEAGKAIAERLAKSDPSNADRQRDLSASLDRMGDVQIAQDDYVAAQRSYEAARAIRERLVQGDPGNAGWQRDLSISLTKVGDALFAQQDIAAALQSYEAGRAIRERLTRSDPANAAWQYSLFISNWRIAGVLELMPGRLVEARAAMARAVGILTGLARTNRLAAGNAQFVGEAKARLADIEARLAAGER